MWEPTRKVFFKKKGKHEVNGTPDIIVVLRGSQFVGIEVKSKVGRLTDSQIAFQAEMHKIGGIYIVARCVADVAEIIEPLVIAN